MHWIAPPAKDPANDTLEKRLWAAADQFRANSGLKAQESSVPVLGLTFLRFGEVRFGAQRSTLEKAAAGSRRGSRLDEPAAYHPDGVLPAYDEPMENSQRRIRLLEAMASALYREWFVHFRFPGHETHPRVASPGDIPESWEVASINDVCEQVTDGSHSSPTSVDEGMPQASSNDMPDCGYTMQTRRFISCKDFDAIAHNHCEPNKNNAVITIDRSNYVKRIVINCEERDAVLLSSIANLRPKARINPHLLAATLSSPKTKGRLKNYVNGAAIPRIVLKDFKPAHFLLPSEALQKRWAKIEEPVTEQCWRLMHRNQNLLRTCDLLLPRLLLGQLELATEAA